MVSIASHPCCHHDPADSTRSTCGDSSGSVDDDDDDDGYDEDDDGDLG